MKRTISLIISIALAFIAFPAIASASVCFIPNGCTGTSTAPAYGQLLIGGKNSEYELVATSTLFSTTSAAYWLTQQTTSGLAEGSNLYFTNGRAVSALTGQNISIFTNNSGYLTGNQTITLSGDETGSGATSITTAFNLANSHWWTARQNFTNATTSGFEATSTDVFLDGYASALLSANSSHQLAAYAGASDPCSANQAPTTLSALGVLGGCTSTFLTSAVTSVSGTTNQIGRTGGNTPTLSLPTLVIFPSDFISQASSTVVGTFQAGTTTANALVITNNSTSTFTGGIQTSALYETGASTSTFANGINLIAGGGGCFAINNVCVGGSGGSGTVTSVALSAPSIFSVSGSPVTTSGTLTFAYNGTALPIANGGTDQTSFSGTNALINFDGTHLSSPSTSYKLSSSLLTAPNASTTNLTSVDDRTLFMGSISPVRVGGFKLATTTTWGGTTTEPFDFDTPAPFTGVIKTETCYTDAGTVEMELTDGSTHIYWPASSTASTYSVSLAMTANDKMQGVAGNPATAPTWVTCAIDGVQI